MENLRAKHREAIKTLEEMRTRHHEAPEKWSDEDRSQWNQCLKNAESLAETIAMNERMGTRTGGVPGRDDRRDGPIFRDARSGRIIRSIGPTESLLSTVERDGEPGEEGADLGATIAAMVTGRTSDLGPAERGALNGIVGGQGGALLNPQMSATVLDLARSRSVCMAAGARVVPMETSELVIAKINQDPEAVWQSEAQPVPATSMGFGRFVMRARALKAIVPCSIELLEDAENAGQVIVEALRASMGVALDRAALVGDVDGAAPLSLLHTPGVNLAAADAGAPTDYSHPRKAIEQILAANYSGDLSFLTWVLAPRDGAAYDAICTGEGEPMPVSPWIAKLQRSYTTSIAPDGDGKTCSLIGDFSQMLFGMRTSGVAIRVIEGGSVVDEDGETIHAPSTFTKFICAHLRCDVLPMRPGWFAKITGLEAPAA
ncbi:MAG: phage major capsid protein [Pirellulaceae bacterium]|nr:phage major capsid protein [Pirellulaceae bacterium]